ncbi:hypothetical protein [Burkholderia oklahomensis]|uniref:hypothetical protein n=2 Tax=Burkholderia oklahomensis TaxID=342113 RepID=UPI00130D77C8|nr:hypothetical protein [Burkholderia oklahomensis]QPS36704.1 hypothetical protein I6G57_15525 [Burkholderia oklahomensis]
MPATLVRHDRRRAFGARGRVPVSTENGLPLATYERAGGICLIDPPGVRRERGHVGASSIGTSMNLGIHVAPFYRREMTEMARPWPQLPLRIGGRRMSCAPQGFSNAGGCCGDSRSAFWEAVTASIRAFAIMSRSHSGCGIQQDLTVFVKPAHIDMNYSDVVEMLLHVQTRRNGMIPNDSLRRAGKTDFCDAKYFLYELQK